MRYAVPAVALVGLVCLALTPIPVIWGLVTAMTSLVVICGVILVRWLDAALLAVLRRHDQGRRRPVPTGPAVTRRAKGAERAA